MAGIVGILDTSASTGQERLRALASALAEQAPGCDSGGTDTIADETAGIALAAAGVTGAEQTARLTTITRSPSGRFLIAMTGGNGPFTRMRATLKRNADTTPVTTLIAMTVELLGAGETLALCDGPLALAVWDRAEQSLTIGRDRLGQEPLFAAWAGDSFVFGSHLFSLVAHPQFRRDIDRGAVAHYLRFSTFHSPVTAFRDAVRINPGSIVTVRADHPGAPIAQAPVATVRDDAVHGLSHRYIGSADEATNALERALQTSIREAAADPSAPLGVFFSGGVDSTLIASVAASMGERPVHAITTGFNEAGYDESQHARAIAQHLGITHHVLPFTSDHMRDLLVEAPLLFQEPFGDLAAYPSIQLARAAGAYAPVVMTGDGGDELFQGRPRDFMLWRARQRVNRPAQIATGFGLDLLAFGAERARPAVDRYAPHVLARYLRPTRIKKAAAGFHARTSEELIAAIFCDTLNPGEFVRNTDPEPPTHYHNRERWLPADDPDDRWRFAVFQAYTLEREIPKHQRALASAGVAYRSIFFHPEVTNLAWSLPPALRDYNDVSRALIRNIINRSVPPALYEREKAGFNVPFDRWLRGPLRDIAEELLADRRLAQEGIFNPAPVQREWEQHLSGKYDRRFILFDLISFQLWVESMKRVRPAL
jgi:asparagine synthase (glutamine-hydrolysing)